MKVDLNHIKVYKKILHNLLKLKIFKYMQLTRTARTYCDFFHLQKNKEILDKEYDTVAFVIFRGGIICIIVLC